MPLKKIISALTIVFLLMGFLNTASAQIPNAPTGLSASAIKIKSFKLSWIASSSTGITGYEVFKDGVSVGTTGAAVTNFAVTGLTFGTAYSITVKAKSATGTSAASTALGVTTSAALQINTASTAPVIDGNVDVVWANAVSYACNNVTRGLVTDDDDLSGTVKMLSDNANLYILLEVKDDIVKTNSATEAWQNDGVEMFFDMGWEAPNTYGANDFQYVFCANNLLWKEYKHTATAGVVYKAKTTLTGYRIEASIPWTTTTGASAAGTLMGFDMNIIDIDTKPAGEFDAKKAWYGVIDEAYNDPSLLGVAKLTGSSVLDTQAPTVPVGLTSSAITPSGYTISWTASTDNVGVANYEVFKDGISAGNTTTTSLTLTGLACNTAGSITVKATDASGNSSVASAALSVSTATCDAIAPSVPTALASSDIRPSAFTLSWTASTDNIAVTGYDVYKNGVLAITTTTATTTLLGLTCETIYAITIKAKDQAGNTSAASTVLSVTTGNCADFLPPSVPAGFTTTLVTTTGFTLNWIASTDNIGVTNYEVFKGGVSLGTTAANSFAVTNLICERVSEMTVKAKDAAGNVSTASAVYNATTASCAVTYEAELAALSGGVIATDHAGYTGTGFWANVTSVGNAAEFTVTAATAGKKGVNCRYAAGNGNQTLTLWVNNVKIGQLAFAGTGGWGTWGNKIDSIQVNAGINKIKYSYETGDNGTINIDNISFNGGALDIDAPSVPTGLSYSANTTTGFTLSWKPSIDNVATTGYEIFNAGVSVGTTTTATSLAVTGLTCGFYNMTVKAKDAAGNVSNASAVFSAVTEPCANANALYVNGASTSTTMDGTFANPYKTIQQAADIVTAGKTIFVRAGIYKEEVKMKADGVTYQTFNNEEVTVDGTDQLKGWAPVAGGFVFKTTMSWNGEVANQLFADKKMMYATRWPKQTSADMINPTDAMAENVETVSGNLFKITDNQFNEPAGRWVGSDIWVNLSHNGSDGQGWTGKVVEISGNTITVDFREVPRLGDQPWGLGTNTQYYLFNPTPAAVAATGGVNALLGKGEWYKNGTDIYVRTPNDAPPNETGTGINIVEARKRELAFHSSDPEVNRNSYTIKGFNLFACAITTDEKYKMSGRNAIIVEDAYNITIDGIKAKYISHFDDQTGNWQSQWSGNTGIVLSGRNNIIRNATLQYSAGPALCVIGFGNKVLNNTILDANYSCSNSGALNTEAQNLDTEIGFNTITNTTVMAINYKGFKNSNPKNKGVARIHHNKVVNALVRGWDSGSIDAVALDGQWIRIDHNIVYNTYKATNGGLNESAKSGIYCDFGGGSGVDMGNYIIDHNVVYNLRYPLLINNIKKMNIYNNVFLSNTATDPGIINGNTGTGLEDTIRNNIMSSPPNTLCCPGYNLKDAVIENNIMNAQGTVAFELFTDTANHNYTLRPTALDAIDKGLDFAPFNDPIVGSKVDIGAFEFGNPAWTTGTPTIPSPRILTSGGDYYDSVSVMIVSDSTAPQFVIRYTTDGTEPVFTSPVYTGSLLFVKNTFLKAATFVSATSFSVSSAASYVVILPDPNVILRNPDNVLFAKQGVIRNYYEFPSSANYNVLPNLDNLVPAKIDTVNLVGLYQPYRPDNFILQFKGFIEVQRDGVYKFFTTSDDNSKFYIGNQLVVNNDFLQAPTERAGSVGLKKGKHEFTAQFMEAGGGEFFTVNYQGPGTTKRPIAATTLWYSNVPSADIAISPGATNFLDEGVVKLSSSSSLATIYYTTDGSLPTLNSMVYTGPIAIINNVTINAVAYIGTVRGNSTSASFTVTPLIGGPRAVLYPNPSNDGRFKIKFKNPGAGQTIGINIFDARGRSVYRKNIIIISGGRTQVESFDLPFLKPALYLISLKTVSNEAGNTLNEEINLIVK